MQAIGAGGGIIATGVGFAFPTLFFLDEAIFNAWLTSPLYFCGIFTLLCLIAGGLGLLLGSLWSQEFIDEQKAPFPVSKLTYQIIPSQNHPQQSARLMGGIGVTAVVCLLRDGIW